MLRKFAIYFATQLPKCFYRRFKIFLFQTHENVGKLKKLRCFFYHVRLELPQKLRLVLVFLFYLRPNLLLRGNLTMPFESSPMRLKLVQYRILHALEMRKYLLMKKIHRNVIKYRKMIKYKHNKIVNSILNGA